MTQNIKEAAGPGEESLIYIYISIYSIAYNSQHDKPVQKLQLVKEA